MKKIILSLATIALISFGTSAQNVNIPDVNFKAYLVGNNLINTSGDTEIQVSEATAFTGDIFASNLNITDLTGVEAFTSVTGLYCRDNNLGSIDVSANTALTYLDCRNANLAAMDISSNTALGGVDCSLNSLSSLDLSNNSALSALTCFSNNLTSLDVSNNVLLSNFSCDNNNLTSLDVSNNTALSYFVCYFNDLTSIDVSNCTALAHFSCVANDLTSLDVSNNAALGALYCGANNISVLDLGANTSLQILNCSDNDLSILNVANGNNINFFTFAAQVNPNLTCIEVDDDVWSTANWTSIDAGASFSTDCGYVYLVSSIIVQGEAGASSIATQSGTLQMEAEVLPLNADDATYTWSVANGTGSASIGASGLLTAMTNGTVIVTATANDASGITGSAVITISNQDLGVGEQTIYNVSIYPNPVNSELNIDSEQNIETLVILDVMGQTVKTINAPNNTIDVSELTKGIYFLQIQTGTVLLSKKFIKK